MRKIILWSVHNTNRPFSGQFKKALYTFHMEKENVALLFAENLTRYRKKKGFSQYDLAELTGISRTMISHYEREGIIPPADKLQSITTAFEIPVCKLFEQNTHRVDYSIDLTGIDPRSVKKFRDILSLPIDDRNDLYRILNKMLRKNQLERQSSTLFLGT